MRDGEFSYKDPKYTRSAQIENDIVLTASEICIKTKEEIQLDMAAIGSELELKQSEIKHEFKELMQNFVRDNGLTKH
jgi:hypothetical protein